MHTLTSVQQWNDDDIYNAARMFTVSVAQHITLHEFGPLVLGLNTTQETPNHDPNTSPAVDVFAALALSYAQSSLGPVDRLLDADWLPLPSGDLSEVTAPAVCTHDYQQQLLAAAAAAAGGGLDAVLRGMVLADGAAVDAFMPRGSGSNACSVQPVLTVQVSIHLSFYSMIDVLLEQNYDSSISSGCSSSSGHRSSSSACSTGRPMLSVHHKLNDALCSSPLTVITCCYRCYYTGW
jgi:Animal haem peroxidase